VEEHLSEHTHLEEALHAVLICDATPARALDLHRSS
jgi:hypothetical protein